MFQQLRQTRHLIVGLLLLAWGALWLNTHVSACSLGDRFDQTAEFHCDHPCCEHQGGDHHSKAGHLCPVMLADAIQSDGGWLPDNGHWVSFSLPASALDLPARISFFWSGVSPGFAWSPQEHPALRYRSLLN